MKNQKQISFKTQYLLSLIPYVGVFIVAFCGFVNLKKLKNKRYSYILGYWFCIFMPAIFIMGVTVFVAQSFVGIQNITAYTTTILVGMYLATLMAALFGVWLQKREIKKMTEAENNAYMQ